jgi:hypothetical protein
MMLAGRGVARASALPDGCTDYAAVEKAVQQPILKSARCNYSAIQEDSEQQSIMGWGKSRSEQLEDERRD